MMKERLYEKAEPSIDRAKWFLEFIDREREHILKDGLRAFSVTIVSANLRTKVSGPTVPVGSPFGKCPECGAPGSWRVMDDDRVHTGEIDCPNGHRYRADDGDGDA